jgi:hypothetical protein
MDYGHRVKVFMLLQLYLHAFTYHDNFELCVMPKG